MAKHEVICTVCKQKFDTNLIQAVHSGPRRYAHAACLPDNTDFVPLGPEADPELIKLKEYIGQVYGEKGNYALIAKQIKKFHDEDGMSYNAILKSLVYFYDVKHNTIDSSKGGIGIVPFIQQDAKNYFLALFLAQNANEDKTLSTIVKEYTISPPKMRGTKHKLLEWSVYEDEE